MHHVPNDRPDEHHLRSALLRVSEVEHVLGISRRSVWRLISLGELERVQIGRAVRIPRKSVEAFIAKGGAR